MHFRRFERNPFAGPDYLLYNPALQSTRPSWLTPAVPCDTFAAGRDRPSPSLHQTSRELFEDIR
jgi:hypothetical protein